MAKLWLITGFLGAGKTTLLKGLIPQLAGLRLRVIVNEYGREGIDGALLRETGTQVDEINNGSIFCSCRLDQFEDALARAAAQQPDIILVEASGLSDPTHIEKVLAQAKGAQEIEYMGCVCLADAVSFKKVLITARVCRKQVSVSDLVLLNKTDLVPEEALAEAEALIREVKPDAQIRRTTYGQVKLSWLEGLHEAAQAGGGPAYHLKDVSLQKLRIVLRETMTLAQLEKFLAMFVEDTHRVKGFVRLEGRTALVDCVGARVQILPYEGEAQHVNTLVAMAGGAMPMEAGVRKAAEWYPQHIEAIEWDE